MLRFVIFCLLGAWLAYPQPVSAEAGRSCVALVRNESNDPLLKESIVRLRAEMRSNGIEVVEVNRDPGDASMESERDSDGNGCFAIVALQSSSFGATANVWIDDDLTGKTDVRRIKVLRTTNAAGMLAIHVFELLRASLLKIDMPVDRTESERERTKPHEAPRRRPKEPVSTPPTPSLDKAPIDRFAIGLGALGLFGTKGLGFSVGPGISLRYGFTRLFWGRLSLAGTFLGSEPERDEGRAILHQEFASLDFGLVSDTRPFGVLGWIGVGAFNLHVEGLATAPNRATSDNVVSFLMNAGLGATARLAKWFALSADAGVIWLIPQPVVVIANRESGVAGAPSVSLSVGVLIFVK